MKNNSALRTLFFYNSIFVFAANIIGPLFALYVQKFQTNVITISGIWAIYTIFTTIFTYLIYKFGDHIKEKEYYLLAGYLIRSFSWFFYIFAKNINTILFIQILLALGESFGSPAFDAIFSEHIDSKKRISEYSEWKIISNLSIAFAGLLGGFLVYKFGFEALFLTMSLISLFCFFGILTKPRKLL